MVNTYRLDAFHRKVRELSMEYEERHWKDQECRPTHLVELVGGPKDGEWMYFPPTTYFRVPIPDPYVGMVVGRYSLVEGCLVAEIKSFFPNRHSHRFSQFAWQGLEERGDRELDVEWLE